MNIDNDFRNRLFQDFLEESDRGCAVLTVCLIEEMLTKVYARVLPEGQASARNFMPRGRLKTGVKNAVALGLISEPHATNMKLIIGIRNSFAHKLLDGLSFESPEIKSRTMSLTLPNLNGMSEKSRSEIQTVSRVRYMHVFGFEVANLERLARIATPFAIYESLPMYSFEV